MPDGNPPKDAPGADDELDSLAARFHAGETPGATAGLGEAIQRAVQARADDTGSDEPSTEDLRSGALARRLAQRRGYSIAAREPKPKRLLSSWGLGAVMLLSLWSLWGTGADLRYWASNEKPVDLGHLGGYHLENAQEGAFAHVEGVASPKRASYSRMFSEHELFPLIASRILVDRAREPDESLHGFGFPFSGEGRLVRASEGSKWDAVREQFVNAGELAHSGDIWVLEEGVSPHKGLRVPGEVAFWGLIFLACAVTLALRARRKMSQPA